MSDGVWTYVYDQDNRLKSATKSATKSGYAATLTYDLEGRLNTTQLRYDGTDLVVEYAGDASLWERLLWAFRAEFGQPGTR